MYFPVCRVWITKKLQGISKQKTTGIRVLILGHRSKIDETEVLDLKLNSISCVYLANVCLSLLFDFVCFVIFFLRNIMDDAGVKIRRAFGS